MSCRQIDHHAECVNCGAHIAETCRVSSPPREPPSKAMIASWQRTEREWQRYLTAPDRDQWREYLGVMWSPAEAATIAALRSTTTSPTPAGEEK